MARRDNQDRIDSTLSAEPMLKTDANDPTDPIENADPTEPMDMNELRLRIDSTEFVDL